MFEGDIKKSDMPTSGEGEALRRLRWHELVAQLAATRDLRNELAQSSLAELANRGRFSSLSLFGIENGQPVVNHDGLSHGKAAFVKDGNTAYDAAASGRGHS